MKPLHKATLWILTAFCAGALLGASISYLYLEEFHVSSNRRADRPDQTHIGERDGPSQKGRLMIRVEERLDLDKDQKETIHKLLETGRDQFRAISKQSHEESAKVRDSIRQGIIQILRPEQVEEFNKMMSEKDKFPPFPKTKK